MHTTTHHVVINLRTKHFISNYFVGCATNITTVDEIAEEREYQTHTSSVLYFAVIGSLGAVIILFAFIIVCFAIRIKRMRRRSNKVQKLFNKFSWGWGS